MNEKHFKATPQIAAPMWSTYSVWGTKRQTQRMWAIGYFSPRACICALMDPRHLSVLSISSQAACDLSEGARFSEDWQFKENCHGITLNPCSAITSLIPFSLSLTHTHGAYTCIGARTSAQTQMQQPNGKPWLLIPRAAPLSFQAFLSLPSTRRR